MILLHVTTPGGWAAVQAAGYLGAEPFVHLCTEGQLAFVLERFFLGVSPLVLVRVEGAGLDVRWEDSEAGMDPFPHLYGQAALSAVVGTEFI